MIETMPPLRQLIDERDYPKQIQVTDADLAAVNLKRDEFHPEWNYSIAPSS